MLEAVFSEIIGANKKTLIFQQGNCTMNVLHPSLSKSFVLSICNRNPMKNSTLWDIFTRVLTAKCIASCSHGGSLEDDYCITFFKLKFLIPTLCQMFCSPKPSNIYGESDIVSPLCEISWKNIHFCGLKKETFISNGRKKLVNSSKRH